MTTIRFRSSAFALLVAAASLSACANDSTSPFEPTLAPVSARVEPAREAVPTIPWAIANSAVPTIPWAVASSVPTIPWAISTNAVPTIPWN